MKKKTRIAIFWIVAIVLIVLFVFCEWTVYAQFVGGLGQEPNLFGFIGWALSFGGGK